jgi:hypothetical protein
VFAWLAAFAVTQIIEMPIYVFALRERPWVQRLALAFGASAITHPFVWFLFPRLVEDYWTMVALAETFAVVVEAVWLWRFGLKRAILWTLLANGTSVGIGFALYALGIL